ncbi:hypothetical protein GE061_002647 [Apolygus lucorum]|uniref:Carboxylic ester hydrolase n=1 Tax=Apolygus lucorum TaxID=248454 RepID=A0A6A4JA52_APOLU|nr:hypothetical protein GE061_002647 [Apolygus lucorum]
MPSLLHAALLACAAIAGLTSAEVLQPQVTTSLGTLVGSVQQTVKGRNFYAFQGVPYAKPPVGKHRFKQSVPIGPWTGVYNATRVPNMCIQESNPIFAPHNPLDSLGVEDCLYLNVFTPKLPSEQADGKLLDVIVYIHGGAFKVGAGNIWGPLILLDRDVILVTFNYRLGVMGFLSLEDNLVPGNNGLKDQTLALQWVQKYISSFGGDPTKVTIAGMSAGGASVHYHMLSPSSAGLFKKAISNSGSPLNPWAITKNPRATALSFAKALGCPINDTLLTLRCLRERPAEHVIGAVAIMTGGDILTLPFLPVVEPPGPNAFIDEHPIDLIEAKGFNDVPALFSYCDDEGSIFSLNTYLDEKKLEAVESNWDVVIPQANLFDVDPVKGKEIAQQIRKRFLGDKPLKDSAREYSQMFGERMFVDGIQKAAILHAEHQTSPVYSYRFSFVGPTKFNMLEAAFDGLGYKGGASHGSDNSYLFNALYLKPIKDFPELMGMAETMTDIWMKFIAEDPVSGWSSVKSGLPKITFLDVKSSNPSENLWKTEETVGQQFWDSLNLPQANSETTQNDQHSEL